jgi:diguanylate cyclase (GGDEF)-like protein
LLVVSLVFVIGILNLVLGFALAIALEKSFVIYLPTFRSRTTPAPPTSPAPTPIAPISTPPPAPVEPVKQEPPAAVPVSVPDAWAKALEAANAEFRTFVEASAHVLRLEVGAYREDLLDIEDLIRSGIAKNNPDSVRDAVQELVTLNDEWVSRQVDAARVMSEKQDAAGLHTKWGIGLESRLRTQSTSIQDICARIASVDLANDEEGSGKIIEDLGHLVRLAHELRDAIQEATIDIVLEEGRLDSVDRSQFTDTLTGLKNQFALEKQLRKWWHDDSRRQRTLSVALLDVDNLGKLNEFASTRVADRIGRALVGVIRHQVGNEPGFERVFRVGGHRFLLLYADTSHDAATTGVERVRAAIEASQFEYREKQYRATIRAGVTAALATDEVSSLLKRLESLVAAAKEAGGNCACTDHGNTVVMVPSDESHRAPHTVMVE